MCEWEIRGVNGKQVTHTNTQHEQHKTRHDKNNTTNDSTKNHPPPALNNDRRWRGDGLTRDDNEYRGGFWGEWRHAIKHGRGVFIRVDGPGRCEWEIRCVNEKEEVCSRGVTDESQLCIGG